MSDNIINVLAREPQTADEMRRYVAEHRGTPLIRVGPGLWMFGSGNW